jgi:hypothetical protein
MRTFLKGEGPPSIKKERPSISCSYSVAAGGSEICLQLARVANQ